jgi:hypothetical protein
MENMNYFKSSFEEQIDKAEKAFFWFKPFFEVKLGSVFTEYSKLNNENGLRTTSQEKRSANVKRMQELLPEMSKLKKWMEEFSKKTTAEHPEYRDSETPLIWILNKYYIMQLQHFLQTGENKEITLHDLAEHGKTHGDCAKRWKFLNDYLLSNGEIWWENLDKSTSLKDLIFNEPTKSKILELSNDEIFMSTENGWTYHEMHTSKWSEFQLY